MYTLYYSPGSASMAPHGVPEESGAPYTLAGVDMAANKHKDAAYLKLIPHGRVPTLVVDGKQPIYESTAICLFIADRHPTAGLADPNVARCAGLVAARPAIRRVLQQNQAA
jgi:glutathione S-transferase